MNAPFEMINLCPLSVQRLGGWRSLVQLAFIQTPLAKVCVVGGVDGRRQGREGVDQLDDDNLSLSLSLSVFVSCFCCFSLLFIIIFIIIMIIICLRSTQKRERKNLARISHETGCAMRAGAVKIHEIGP